MTKHVHAEMIKAKADSMELVVISKRSDEHWRIVGGWPEWFQDREYFLCLPQHKETCLHWLNGGDVLAVRFDNQMPDSGVMIDSELTGLDDDINSYPWKLRHIFMDEAQTIVIKPRKEKRWIAIKASRGVACSLYESETQAREENPHADQFIEIEVESDLLID